MGEGNLYLVLGGARSGKSGFAISLAESYAEGLGVRPVYVATAPAAYAGGAPDHEMAARIEAHKAARGGGWNAIEEPLELARAVKDGAVDGVLLVDCLTLWVTNLMERGLDDDGIIERAEALAGAADTAARPVIFVSNEVGQGIVPESALGRRFRDLSGMINQRVAARAKAVYFVTAGIAQKIKG